MIFEHTRNAPFGLTTLGACYAPRNSRRRAPDVNAARSMRKLCAIEDRWISEAVLKQQRVGLQSITDGEFRRGWWNFDFLGRIEESRW